MSVEAISWALAQPIKHSSAKFVLVVMANCADGQHFHAWPSTAYLAEATGQDRKTVLENMKRLREMGYIEDTGERKGGTGQVVVYRLKSPNNGTVSAKNLGGNDAGNDTENGTVGTPKLSTNDTGLGTVKQTQKRNSLSDETVPFFPSNSPNFPVKQSQFSHETVPKTGHGTVMEPSLNRQGKENSLSQQSSSRASAVGENQRPPSETTIPARNVQIAVLLRSLGVRPMNGSHPLAMEWAANEKVTDELLKGAAQDARDYKPTGNIPTNYLAQIVAGRLNPPEPKPTKPQQDWSWAKSHQGIDKMARELGIRVLPIHTYEDVKRMCFEELRKRQGGKAA